MKQTDQSTGAATPTEEEIFLEFHYPELKDIGFVAQIKNRRVGVFESLL
jgi:hypothetical protein